MSSIAIYMEGGGESTATKGSLRRGMDIFLREAKDMARARAWHWKLVCCGSRRNAFRGFEAAHKRGNDTILLLLVDSEIPTKLPPRAHLSKNDGWEMDQFDDNSIHLMVQIMETWLISDPDALVKFYGGGFLLGALPRRMNLEEVEKNAIEAALARATSGTQKKRYHKIKHASQLLGLINPSLVRKRCPHCDRLLDSLYNCLSEK